LPLITLFKAIPVSYRRPCTSRGGCLGDHLIDVGQRSALERVAHFLLELLTRLQVIGLADERSYQMPLTQELVGDALGSSVPHVSRTLRQLREEDLVAIEGGDKDVEAQPIG
jgi:CRP-like cAMP-binding protein